MMKHENVVMRHPAQRLYLITIVLLGLTVIFGFIAVFVPWVMKDIAVAQRAWAYPFKTCIEDTFSKTNAEACQDNDFIEPTGVPLTGGSATCKAFILATIAFVFISVILGVVILLALAYVAYQIWMRPVVVAGIAQFGLIIVCIAAFLSWIMFICYAERTCAPGSIFPVRGYSYGFILYIFASAFSLGAVVTGFMGFRKLKSFRPQEQDGLFPLAPQEIPVYAGATYPIQEIPGYAGSAYPMYPIYIQAPDTPVVHNTPLQYW